MSEAWRCWRTLAHGDGIIIMVCTKFKEAPRLLSIDWFRSVLVSGILHESSSSVLPITVILSRHTRQLFHNIFLTCSPLIFAGAIQRPKGITVNCHNPVQRVKAVFSRSAGYIFTCQFPLLKSSMKNDVYPAKASRV